MKKTHLFIAAMLVFVMAAGSKANAQTTMPIALLTDAKSMEKVLALTEPTASINSKAMRDFKRSFPDAEDEQWYSFKDGYAVRFKEEGKDHMVTYNRGGDWQYTIANYGERNLPQDIRALVKSTYYDYTITLVQEVTAHDQTVYLVHMQDESTWKTLRVSDGEMSIIEDFNKK
ncbi:MAG: hypothetical protein JST75_06805 [Bacteroidetes bacterium]|nr:hypothetical protein [Bacteroidota bacterium]